MSRIQRGTFYICRTDSSKSCRLPPTIRRHLSDANPVVNPTDQANLFNKYFHSVFNHVDNEPPSPGCHANVSVRKRLSYITLPVSDVLATLLHLDPSKSPGPDGIPSLLLRNLAPQISNSITYILNESLNDGIFPSKWKDRNLKLTPIFKSDQKDVVSNYRGIALLPIVSKVLERQVHTRFYQQGLLYSQQHGFRKQRSCITQLLQFNCSHNGQIAR